MPHWIDRVRRTVLPSGLTVLAYRDASSPAAAVITHVKAGFFDEPDHWSGVSHVLEHMFFKGTPRRGVGEIARQTKAAGGYLNAGTSYDYTIYYVVLPARHLAVGMEIQADALRHSLIDHEELGRELQVIIQEAKRKRDTPGAVTTETLFEVLHDRHRIRRWRIGHEEHLAQLTRDDVAGYYHSRYRPDRTVVSVVGDADPEEMTEMAVALYGDWDVTGGAIESSPAEPGRREVRTRTIIGDVAQSHLALGWRTVDPLHPDSLLLEVAATVLSSGRGSWLQQALRNAGIVSSVSAYQFAPTELGVFGIGATLAAERLEDAVSVTGTALRQLAAQGPSEEDLDRARTLMLTRMVRRLEPTDGRAASLAAAEALRDLELLQEDVARVGRVGRDDVREAVARWIDFDSTAAVAYLTPGAEPLESGRLRELLSQPAAFSSPVAAPVIAAGKSVGPLASTEYGSARHAELPGADLVAWRKAGVETATVGVYFRRETMDPIERAGWGSLAVRSAVRGAGPFDAAGFAIAMERLGGSVAARCGSDWFGFGATVEGSRLASAASMLRLLLAEPSFAEDEIDRERVVMIEECRQLQDDMLRFPLQLAFRARFGERGYGVPVGGTVESLESVGPSQISEEFTAMTSGRPLVVVVGGDAPQDLLDRVAESFLELPARAPSPPVGSLPVEPPVADQVVVTRAKSQTALALVFPGPGRRDRLRHAAEVWAAVASGLSGRLFEALREKRGLAYSVLASSWQRRGAGALVSYIATGPEREDEAREAMLEELARFAGEPVTDEELTGAINYLAGQRLVGRQTAESVASEIADAWLNGEGLEELADPAAEIQAVTVADVAGVARDCLTGERVEAVVRGTLGS